jgi:hypothetical protein
MIQRLESERLGGVRHTGGQKSSCRSTIINAGLKLLAAIALGVAELRRGGVGRRFYCMQLGSWFTPPFRGAEESHDL